MNIAARNQIQSFSTGLLYKPKGVLTRLLRPPIIRFDKPGASTTPSQSRKAYYSSTRLGHRRSEMEDSQEESRLLSNYEQEPSNSSSTPTDINTPSPSTNNTFTTPSGRTISYAQYGCPDDTSPTIIYLHGYPSSRLEASILHHLALAHSPPIRIIAPDRPGYGFTSPLPPSSQRTISTYPPTDLFPLITHLHLTHFSLLGLSGGGPYALAATLHPTMTPHLAAIGIACGAPYWHEQPNGWSLLPWWSKLGYYTASYTPWLFRLLLWGSVLLVRQAATWQWLTTRLDKVIALEHDKRQKVARGEEEESPDEPISKAKDAPADIPARKQVQREVALAVRVAMGEALPSYSAAASREDIVSQILEPFRQGTRAAVEELLVYSRNWGFKLSDVDWKDKNGKGIVMWHGTLDVNAPIGSARYMAGEIPGCELREFEGTHGEIVCRIEEMLRELARPLIAEGGGQRE